VKDWCGRKNTRVARFFFVKHTKIVKIYQIARQFTKWQYNLTSNFKNTKCPKIHQKFSFQSLKKMYQNWDFWFENVASGNPDKHYWQMPHNEWATLFFGFFNCQHFKPLGRFYKTVSAEIYG
jgi:hypothetical protein